MLKLPTPALVALLLAAPLASPQAARANCGAEGCPLAPRGPEATIGRFSFNLGYQTIEQNRLRDGGHDITAQQALLQAGGVGHVLEQLTRTRTTLVQADVRVTRRLALALSLPYVERVHRHAVLHHAGFLVGSEWHMRGLGDATALASWAVLDGTRSRAGWLTLQVGAKFPTGKTDVPQIGGEVPEPSARPGSGSTDAMAALQYRRDLSWPAPGGRRASVPLTAGVSARVNGRGSESYRMGSEWDANVGAGYPLVRSVRLLAQLNASWHARDEAGTTDAVPHETGSAALYASPGAQVLLAPGMSAFGYYQFPLAQHSNGPQLVSPYHLSFGIAYAVR
jgi:hypothetical protein